VLIQPPQLLCLWLRRKAAVPSGFMIRRSLLKHTGEFEESFRGLYEDQAFAAKACLHSPTFASARCWYLYRQHPESSCAVSKRAGQDDAARATFLKWLEQYLIETGVTDPSVWDALGKELWLGRHPLLQHYLRTTRRFLVRGRAASWHAADAFGRALRRQVRQTTPGVTSDAAS
jgi:hypothetical protein